MNALAPDPLFLSEPENLAAAREASAARSATLAFVLLPGFDLLALTVARELFRLANRNAGAEQFRILHLSSDGGPVMSGQSLPQPVDAALSDTIDAELTLVFGGDAMPDTVPPAIPALLRRLWRRGRSVGAVQGGIFALAQAGVLGGNRFAASADHLVLLRMRWPNLTHVNQLYAIHNRILTCVGGLAAADLSLRVIHDLAGPEAAQAAMHACQMTAIREEATPQPMQYAPQTAARSAYLSRALRWLDRNFAREDCLATLPDAAGTSARHLQRLFKTHLGQRPLQYVLELRLSRAKLLLSQTELSIADVAESCGFGTSGTFTKNFRQRFGITPSRYSPFGGAPRP